VHPLEKNLIELVTPARAMMFPSVNHQQATENKLLLAHTTK
jgi:hypothetical protein